MDREGREAERERGRALARRAAAQEQRAQIKEHKHQADLAKLEDKREGEQMQRLNQLYQLEIQRGREKEQEEKVERQRQYHAFLCAFEKGLSGIQWEKAAVDNKEIVFEL
ncbi:cilia- and flagella- associated protein 210-like [Apus apus]|uniref:cilia- and flagella- associated protein 210-like n=1 Tax=Apus apus TaxID=8895 RepID=UPI0021F8BDF4|nr:cilia- and flagella- associated protein 210-like [Apus apus]